MSNSAIPLGERDGQMFRAYEVENGLRCGCVCPACRGALVAANQGEKRFPYFRHAELEACSSGRAEGVRRAAVQVLACHKRLLLPQFNGLAELKAPGDRLLTKPVEFAPAHVALDEVQRFVDLGDELRAHALVSCRGRQLVVRIKVSARQQHERTRRIKEMLLSSMEIDLHQLTDEQINDQEYFTRAVLGDAANRSWIRSLRGELMTERALAELQVELQQLERQWALAEAQRIEREAALEQQRAIEQAHRAEALAAHRLLQQQLSLQQTAAQADSERWKTPQQRRELIAATMLMAAREWSGRGVECGVCHLINAPGSVFCLYCDGEDRRMREVQYPADLAQTLDARLRCSNRLQQSVKAAPSLLVVPELLS